MFSIMQNCWITQVVTQVPSSNHTCWIKETHYDSLSELKLEALEVDLKFHNLCWAYQEHELESLQVKIILQIVLGISRT